jgi:ribonucleoside-diphosphate reductase alpha chain
LEGIFDAIKYQAMIHQSGGGTGFSFSRLRQKGAAVKRSRGVASGPISFMRVFNEATQQIKQGGTRRGANMGILRVDHPDVREFITCKLDGGLTNFNISVAATDKFMKALAKGDKFDIIEPHTDKVVRQEDAREIFDLICECAWRSGDPGMIFIDRINKSAANPVPSLGPVESTNPCGEQPLYPFDACNLGSIFLNYFVKEVDGKQVVDWDELKKTAGEAVRFLDDVIEINPYPLKQVWDTVRSIRRVGLGIGGWADMLYLLGVPYNSEEALDLAAKVMKTINDAAHESSRKLAKVRGSFQ